MVSRFALVIALAQVSVSCGGTSQPSAVKSVQANPESVTNPDLHPTANTPAIPGGTVLSSFSLPRILHHIGKKRTIIMHLDADLVRQSPSFPLLDHFLLSLFTEEFEKVESKCGFSPLEVWSTLTIAWQESASNDGILAGFTGDLTSDQLARCAVLLGDTEFDDSLKALYWPDSNMALYEKGKTASNLEHEIDQGSLIDNAVFIAELNAITEPYASIWAVGILPDQLRKSIGNIGMGAIAPISFTLHVNLESGIDATMVMKFASPTDADSMKNTIKSMLPMLSSGVTGPAKALSNALTVDSQNSTTSLSIQLGQLEVEDLLKAL